ncbi:hypothetical protein Q7P37_006958 [Cladosporium fusiforme]
MSRATALRASFGDRRPPDISRKITACVSCRKLKVKCNIAASGPPCTRCRTRGLSCTVNKSLQMLLEDDASWKEKMEQRLDALERTQLVGQSSHAAPIDNSNPRPETSDGPVPMPAPPDHEIVGAHHVANGSRHGPVLNLTSNLGVFPASSIDSPASRAHDTSEVDLISRHVISLETAGGCLDYFLKHLNRYVHDILDSDVTLADIRKRSSLLVASICAVACFCSAPQHYQACHNTVVAEVSGKVFSTKYSYDDVRALCIAAFWLDDIAPTLSGLAVRIGSQLDLHRCLTKMPHTKDLCYDRTRLFYLVYLCDHHCSLKYGRPPMTQEWRSLKCPTTFVRSKFSGFQDLGLISQVGLWSITRSVFEQFGADIESQAAIQRPAELHRLGQAYDQWLQKWRGMLLFDSEDSSGSVIELYYHTSKLYLYSHIHRGKTETHRTTEPSTIADISKHFRESALSVLRIILDTKMRLHDLPSYFGTMLAFATVALIKTVRDGGATGSFDRPEIMRLLQHLAETLRTIQIPQSPWHPLLSISKGLEHESLTNDTSGPFQDVPDLSFDEGTFMEDIWNMDFTDLGDNWMAFDEH